MSFDLSSVVRRQTTGLDYLLEHFLPSTNAQIISGLSEKFPTFLETGGCRDFESGIYRLGLH